MGRNRRSGLLSVFFYLYSILVLAYLFYFYIFILHLLHGEQWAETGARVYFTLFFLLVLYIGPSIFILFLHIYNTSTLLLYMGPSIFTLHMKWRAVGRKGRSDFARARARGRASYANLCVHVCVCVCVCCVSVVCECSWVPSRPRSKIVCIACMCVGARVCVRARGFAST